MDKSEVYPLIFICIFILFYASISSVAINYIQGNPYDTDEYEYTSLTGYTPNINLTEYIVYDGTNSSNDGLTYYNVTLPMYTENWNVEVPGFHDIEVTVYNTADDDNVFFEFYKRKEGAWLPWDVISDELSKKDIRKLIQDDSTQVNFTISLEKTFNVALIAFSGLTMLDALESEKFSCIIGENKLNASIEESGILSSFVQLVTFSIPDVPPMISFLIASPVMVLGAYLLVRVILMFIPLVPGGG